MDGIRKLGRSSFYSADWTKRFFAAGGATPTCTALWLRPDLRMDWLTLAADGVCSFLAAALPESRLKIVFVRCDRGQVYIQHETLCRLIKEINADDWALHHVAKWMHGYHRLQNEHGVETFFLGTSHNVVLWTASPGCPDTKCLVLGEANRREEGTLMSVLAEAVQTYEDSFQSPLSFPFVLALAIIRVEETKLTNALHVVRRLEAKTGHSITGSLGFKADRDSITDYTAMMSHTIISLRINLRHIKLAECIWASLSDLTTCEGDSESLTLALPLLRQEAEALREFNDDMVERAKNQVNVLFAFLTHEDNKTNVQIANASKEISKEAKDIASDARRDGSSMKTVAVLTMAFLPATYLAALFSMPALESEGKSPFWMYWAVTIPLTLATFLVWAALTQEQWVKARVERMMWKLDRGKWNLGGSPPTQEGRAATQEFSEFSRGPALEFPEIPGEAMRNTGMLPMALRRAESSQMDEPSRNSLPTR